MSENLKILRDPEESSLCAASGALNAVQHFDPKKGRLTTYTSWWARRYALQAKRERSSVIHIPSYVWGNGRGATPERKQLAASAQSIRSLSATINESMGEINWGDTLVDDATPLASAIANEHTQSGNSKSRYLRGLIEQLPAQQQDVLRRRLHGEKLREIAEVYGVTRSRIQQIGENAKCRIKAMAKQQPFTED